jgi:hypothetical protein
MSDLRDIYEKHKIIKMIKDVSISVQFYFCICPINIDNYFTSQNLIFFLKQFVSFGVVKLPQIFHLQNPLFNKNSYHQKELNVFEDIFNVIETYIWLSYIYEKEFIERDLANVLKDRVTKIIDSILLHSKFDLFKDLKIEKSHKNDIKDNLDKDSKNVKQSKKNKRAKKLLSNNEYKQENKDDVINSNNRL